MCPRELLQEDLLFLLNMGLLGIPKDAMKMSGILDNVKSSCTLPANPLIHDGSFKDLVTSSPQDDQLILDE